MARNVCLFSRTLLLVGQTRPRSLRPFRVAAVLALAFLFTQQALTSAQRAGDGWEKRVAELQILLNKRDLPGVTKFFDSLPPQARAGVITEYTGEESLTKALKVLLADLEQAFGTIGKKNSQKSAAPYALYLNHVVNGMKEHKSKMDMQAYVFVQWIEIEQSEYESARLKNPSLPPFTMAPGKALALRQFLGGLGIKSGNDLEGPFATTHPEFKKWYDEHYPKSNRVYSWSKVLYGGESDQ